MKLNERKSKMKDAGALLAQLSSGDLVILGARPGQGKTQLSLALTAEAMKSGRQGVFFTLEYSAKEVFNLFKSIGENAADFHDKFQFDTSDNINADYIMAKLSTVPKGTVVVIDYLQLLDQKRENPELMQQVRALKSFANERGIIMVFLSQINRSYDSKAKAFPSLADIRLPNPLDTKLFNKAWFLNAGQLQVSANN